MSHYGPSGGQYAGQPQDPWHGRQPPEEYTQPADPWSDQDPWGGGSPASPAPEAASPSYGVGPGYDPMADYDRSHDPAYGQSYDSGYAAQPAPAPAWSQHQPASPHQPPKRKASTPLIAVVALLVVVVVAGLAVGGYFVLKNDQAPAAGPDTTAGGTPTPSASAGGAGASTDARSAAKGQCLVNRGTKENPTMQITKCAPGTFEILARFEGTTDYNGKCAGGKVRGYQFYYFFDSEVDGLDFVLCLRKR